MEATSTCYLTTGAPDVPHGTSCSLLTRHHAEAPAVLDHSRTVPQGDVGARPASAGGAVCGERDLIVLDASDVLHDAFAVRCPRIDAESEVRSDFHAINLTSSLPS